MKINYYLLFSVLSILMLSSFSAYVSFYDDYDQVPVLMDRDDFENAIGNIDPVAMESTSRISIKETRIYVIEHHQGIHVIDNTNPSAPITQTFIRIPGCSDMSIKGDMLYTRSAEDLVAIDISDINNVVEINRVRNTFPELGLDQGYYNIPNDFLKEVRPENTVIVAWESKDQ